MTKEEKLKLLKNWYGKAQDFEAFLDKWFEMGVDVNAGV